MKLNRFDVVELQNQNRATILDIKNKEYFAEIVDTKGETIDIRNIIDDEISKVIFTK